MKNKKDLSNKDYLDRKNLKLFLKEKGYTIGRVFNKLLYKSVKEGKINTFSGLDVFNAWNKTRDGEKLIVDGHDWTKKPLYKVSDVESVLKNKN